MRLWDAGIASDEPRQWRSVISSVRLQDDDPTHRRANQSCMADVCDHVA